MRFKTTPMAHQLRGFDLLEGKAAFALLMEQGTGKTKVAIDDAARCWGEGKIDAMLVLAPNGVHTKWVTIELPKHMPDWCPYVAAYFSAGATKKHLATIEKLFERTPNGDPRPMRVLTMNYEALATVEGIKLLDRFTNTFNAYGVVDESQRIKNPKAVRTDAVLKRRRRFPVRRILSGTPVTKAPFDIFSQFYFLDPTILRTDSYTAFKTEYAEMLPPNHYLVKKLQRGAWQKKDGSPSKRVPQIIARDEAGLPQYRNLEKLQRLISKHSYRVLKKDCLDLPEKIYDSLPFDMTPRQAEVYHRMERERRAELMNVIDSLWKEGKRAGMSQEEALMVGRELIVANKLSAMAKLQQITCGYLKLEDGEVVRMFKKVMDNPRNQVLMQSVEDCEGSAIFWAPHRDKIDQIIECLREGYEDEKIYRYDGAVSKKDRMQYVDDFMEGKGRFMVVNPASGATGQTWTIAETAYYYSNSFDLEHRIQSEDRNHRIGTTGHVRYFDLEAIGTIDRKIVESNQAKKAIADMITGDAEL
jgi:SNF2 family DNA or RNA helicase